MSKGSFLGEFEQVVLLAVARLDGEGYGTSVRREIERQVGRDASIGAIYATLSRLEDKGLLESRDGEAEPRRGGRARRHFAISPAGVDALHAARDMMDRMWDGVELGEGSA